jgi:hypothetical protein
VPTTVKRRKPKSLTARKQAREHRRTDRAVAQHREQLLARAVPIEDLPTVDPAESMQNLINRVDRLWRYAAAQVDALKPGVAKNQSQFDHELWVAWDDNNNLVVTSSYWISREQELAKLLGELTDRSIRNGLADRLARAKEAEVVILGEALQRAAEAAGLDDATRRTLGGHLRKELGLLEQGPAQADDEVVEAEVVAA